MLLGYDSLVRGRSLRPGGRELLRALLFVAREELVKTAAQFLPGFVPGFFARRLVWPVAAHATVQPRSNLPVRRAGSASAGTSPGCSRCHDHKYDPVSAADYYSLYGIFQSTRWAFPGGEEQKRPSDFPPLVPRDEAARLDKLKTAELARIERIARQTEGQPHRARQQVHRGRAGPWVRAANPRPAACRAVVLRRSEQSSRRGAKPVRAHSPGGHARRARRHQQRQRRRALRLRPEHTRRGMASLAVIQ